MDMKYDKLPLLIYGTAGASKETYYCIKQINGLASNAGFHVAGFVEKEAARVGESIFDNQKIVASDDNVLEYIKAFGKIGIVIPFGDPTLKKNVFNMFEGVTNVLFPNIIHPSVICDKEAFYIGKGNIIAAGAVLACDIKIQDFNLLNRCCTTGHDVILGSFNTVNPGTVISGNVSVGNECILGAGSTILQNLTIEDRVTIGAGAVLTHDAKTEELLIGIPAKPFNK